MLAGYARKSNVATAIWGLCLLAFVLLLVVYDGQKVPGAVDYLVLLILVIFLAAYFYSFYAYTKGKGYEGTTGILLAVFLGMLPIIGLIRMLYLKDKHPGGVETPVEPPKPVAKPKSIGDKIATIVFWIVAAAFGLLFMVIAIRK